MEPPVKIGLVYNLRLYCMLERLRRGGGVQALMRNWTHQDLFL